MKSKLHEYSNIAKKILPKGLFSIIRRVLTAFLTPIRFSINTGHFGSALRAMAVDKEGKHIPWYTYPSYYFLKHKNFADKTVLEFGGGQSSIWWGAKAKQVITLEGDKEWYQLIKTQMPNNVSLNYIDMTHREEFNDLVEKVISSQTFDVIVIDGLYREEALDIAMQHISPSGVIIVDNSEAYGAYERMAKTDFTQRVDFYGHAPGVILPHSTSVFWREGRCFLFENQPYPILQNNELY